MNPQGKTELRLHNTHHAPSHCDGNCSTCANRTEQTDAKEQLRLAKADFKRALKKERLAREDVERSKEEKRKSLRQPITP